MKQKFACVFAAALFISLFCFAGNYGCIKKQCSQLIGKAAAKKKMTVKTDAILSPFQHYTIGI